MSSSGGAPLRKSVHGRTQLFLPERGTLMREIRCMGGVVRRSSASVFHALPEARHVEGACCWHCCDDIATGEVVVPIPRVYADGVFHVFGRTCSPECAKAYVLEHTTFDRGAHLDVLCKMLREVYGITDAVHETPPRPALRRFGGPFDPRARGRAAATRIVEPPFVSYCMLVEERSGADGTTTTTLPSVHIDHEELPTAPPAASIESLDEPSQPPLFEAFLVERAEDDKGKRQQQDQKQDQKTQQKTQQKQELRTTDHDGASRKRARAVGSDKKTVVDGPIAQFVKPQVPNNSNK